MRNRLRRKRHRELVNIIQKVNRDLANDPLWIGRFRVYLMRDEFVEFDDGSGGILFYYIAICDLKTGECKAFYSDHAVDWSTNFAIFEAVNNFIISIPHVNEDARNDATNYTKVEFTPPSLKDFREVRGAYNGSRLNIFEKRGVE